MSDIIVSFKAQGEAGLLKAIKLLDNAQKGLGNTHKKTTKTTQALNAKMVELAARYGTTDKAAKAAGVSSRIFRRALKGQASAINLVNAGLKKTTVSMGLFGTLTKRNAAGASNLALSFSTMRSKLLLVNFALGMGITQMAKFAQSAAKVEAMETAFNTLAGGSENASVAIDKLGEATNGTLSNFDMFQQANNAMILGVTRNSDEMADLFGMAKKLGDALGRDVASSVESLVTGIGRQSRMMLDNLGIIVDTEKAYKDYASELKKNASDLTDAERKQAFMNATLEAARQKIKDLPEGVSGANESFQQFAAATANLNQAIGDSFLPLITKVAKAMTAIFNAFDSTRIEAYAKAIGVTMVIAVGMYIKSLKKLKIAQARTGFGLIATAIGAVGTEILIAGGAFDDTEEPIRKVDEAVKDVTKTLSFVNTQPVSVEMQKFIDDLKVANQFLDLTAKAIKEDLMASFTGIKPPSADDIFGEGLTAEDYQKYFDEDSASLANMKAIKKAGTKVVQFYDDMARMNKIEVVPMTEEDTAELDKNIAEAEDMLKHYEDTINEWSASSIKASSNFKEEFEKITGVDAELFQGGEELALAESIGTVIQSEEELIAVLDVMRVRQKAVSKGYIEEIALNVRKKQEAANNNDEGKKTLTIQDKLEKAYEGTKQARIDELDAMFLKTDKLFEEGKLTEDQIAGLTKLQIEYAKLTEAEIDEAAATEEGRKARMKSVSSMAMIADSFAALGGAVGASEKEVMAVQAIAAVANAYKAASDTWADESIKPTWLRAAAAASHYVAAYANVRGIYNQIGKIDGAGGGGGGGVSGSDGPIGSFAEGGNVGGRPHSQGGTMIEAERGEFVMSKNAVDSIGLETLNQMNQSGGGGSVNVNVSGNVLTQDFVEGELAESIKEAVRRGSDFGLS